MVYFRYGGSLISSFGYPLPTPRGVPKIFFVQNVSINPMETLSKYQIAYFYTCRDIRFWQCGIWGEEAHGTLAFTRCSDFRVDPGISWFSHRRIMALMICRSIAALIDSFYIATSLRVVVLKFIVGQITWNSGASQASLV